MKHNVKNYRIVHLNKFVRFFLYLYYTQTSNEINNTILQWSRYYSFKELNEAQPQRDEYFISNIYFYIEDQKHEEISDAKTYI